MKTKHTPSIACALLIFLCLGAIVVEPGAKLIVDGARITNDCGAFWKGILVEGNPALPQRPNSNQGVAEVKNGAVMEHARVGMGNNGESVEANPLAVSGGIIRAGRLSVLH